MILVAFRVEADHPWSVAAVRTHAEGLAAQAALLQNGYRSHVFEHDTFDQLCARDGFETAEAQGFPVPVLLALKRRAADRKKPRFIPVFD